MALGSWSEKQRITVELYISVVVLALVLSAIGLCTSRSFWDPLLRALFGWSIADTIDGVLQSKTEGKFTVQIKVRSKRLFRKRLPFPHRITAAYLLYPVVIGIALFYGELVTDLFLQFLSLFEQSPYGQTSLFSLLSELAGKALVLSQDLYVVTASFLLSVILFRNFQSRTHKKK